QSATGRSAPAHPLVLERPAGLRCVRSGPAAAARRVPAECFRAGATRPPARGYATDDLELPDHSGGPDLCGGHQPGPLHPALPGPPPPPAAPAAPPPP